MNRLMKKIGILSAVFVTAIAVYFVWNQKNTEKSDVMVYTSMDEASLPVVYSDMYGRKMNLLHGYTQDMKQTVSREALTVLPPNRSMNIQISDYKGSIQGIEYEVRSMDLGRLVERTTIDQWDQGEEGVTATLPIQNLLAKDKEYLLILSLDTSGNGKLLYYTRIVWTDSTNAKDMIDFAVDFTTKTFDYDQARQLTTYLETSEGEDNSSLGHVTIRSSFTQLTWGGLSVKPVGDIRVTLKDLNGIMCSVRLDYEVSRDGEGDIQELYEVEDSFTMKWDSRRIYLMDFERDTNQIFSGQKGLFSGKRIMLGISNQDEIRTAKSPSGDFLAYAVNRDLWTYDQSREHAVKVFSFRSGEDDGLRSGYDQHDIKILSVKDNGDVDFLVYGYMNRGIHEGGLGVAMYQYSSQDNATTERFFTPVTRSFDMLKEDIGQLAHVGSNGMLYLMADRAVYGIDLNSNEYMVLADSLVVGGYAVSSSERRFAWQESSDFYGAGVVHLMDLDTGVKREITGGEDNIYRPLGFVGDDFIYGIARKGDVWVQNGRTKDAPMYRIEIMDQGGNIVKEYENENVYIADVSVDASRIHLTQVVKSGDQSYVSSKQDTIVCNQELTGGEMEGIGWYASEDRRKLYFVQLEKEAASKDVRITVPKKVAYETTEVVELKSNGRTQENRFYAYGGGCYLGSSRSFTDALALAYDKMGVVTDKNQEIVWNRVNRPPSRNMKEPLKTGAAFLRNLEGFTENGITGDGVLMLDARGCTLNQVLYFIGHGCPVAAYNLQGGYLLLSGYDSYNVTVYNPVSGESQKMGLNDASAYFAGQGNDFVCGVFME
ncbi:hypothetical protein [Lacrimispora saccharolytica]|uniref:Peptidase C39-like domain-containing protein n=1 Tax=Lacrimispora saccharolytica (strain ATCC 35040 / DSM 2544 / NRCC 2533 / WM1) TaxID=610130 RepID=D9R1I0_LACSW|nr:hypothetical protein [Lacrimispora saccharolytica]ADL06503.1 conserved hypothetical protein [[Clostridium] saccharolyticum WM1]QRV19415.1 hypothetical protein I6K70_18520 [Lacrimispora saccharolytica]